MFGIIEVIALGGGIAFFLFGMSIMGSGLEKLSSGRMEAILERLTGKLLMGVLVGAGVTAVIQSSAATTVMVVGFVNAGIMRLSQAVGVIFGANIGTTATSFILALGDINGKNLALQLLNPSSLAPLICIAGAVLYMVYKSGRKHDLGQILMGLGILFFGMVTMEQTVSNSGIKDSPVFINMLTAVTNPVLGVFVGMFITAVLQSSSASIGILQALTSTGAIRFNMAAPIILGQNIGTCITALLSAVGASKNARRAAMIHLYFNIIGTVLFLALLYGVQAIVGLPFWEASMSRIDIALFHLTFNVFGTAVLLPFNKLLLKLATITIKDKPSAKEIEVSILDKRFLSSPSLALDKADEVVAQMGTLALQNFADSVELLSVGYDPKRATTINEREDVIDKNEVRVDDYLVSLTNRSVSFEENTRINDILHAVGDWERIGDYIINLVEVAEQMKDNAVEFTPSAKHECAAILDAINEILHITLESYRTKDAQLALKVEPLEQVVDLLRDNLKNAHIERLKAGECTVISGTLFLELITNLERISDHCSNIAVAIVQHAQASYERSHEFDFHDYLRAIHKGKTSDYQENFAAYHAKYLDDLENYESEQEKGE